MENKLVLDISKFDKGIDLGAWKERRGLWGVIIKAGGNEGGRYSDSCFADHYANAKAAGLHIGAYYYTVTTSVSEAKKDAEHFEGLLKGRSFDLPVYMDVEDPRQFALSRRALTDVIKAFCDRLREHNYWSGLYTGGSAWLNNMYSSELLDYADWIAWWKAAWPSEAGDIGMWQQGGMRLSDGHIAYDDVADHHDLDWCCIDYPSRIKAAHYNNCSADDASAPTQQEQPKNGSLERLMEIAYADLGYYAPSDPERGSKAGRYCAELMGEDWLAGPSTEIWWCCMWVSMILDKAQVKVPGFPSQNTDVAWNGGAKSKSVDKNSIRRGDILIFDWNFATTATDHIGFATGSPRNGYVNTIEGNVGNAVQEKVRPLSSIRYVVRPDYDGAASGTADTSTIVVKNPTQNGQKLDIDGVAGYNTVYEWQSQLGTVKDGEISGQYRGNYQYFEGIVSVTFEGGGSQLVKAVQKKVGASDDGIWGPETSRKTQQWLVDHGYGVGDAGVDGYFGHDSVCGLQQSLNAGAWK